MNISEAGISFIKYKEGYYKNPYWDVKQWSIGYGSYAGSRDKSNKPSTTLTKPQADAKLREEIKSHISTLNSINNDQDYNFNQNEFDALVSFSYNLGQKNLKLLLVENGKRDRDTIGQKILEYDNVDDPKYKKGIEIRRGEELDIFLGDTINGPPSYFKNQNTVSEDQEEAQSDEQAAVAFQRPNRDEPYRRSRQESNRPVSTSDNIRSFATRQFVSRVPGQTQERIEQALGPNLSELAPDIMNSLMTGTGIPLIQESTSRLIGKDVEGRINELTQISAENPTLAQGVFEASGAKLPLGLSFEELVAVIPDFMKIFKEEDPKKRLIQLYGKARELDPENILSVSDMLADVNGEDVREEYQKALVDSLKVETLTLEQLLNVKAYRSGGIIGVGLEDPDLAEAIRSNDLESISKLLARALPGIGEGYEPLSKPGENKKPFFGAYNPNTDRIRESENIVLGGRYEEPEVYSPDVAAAMDLLSMDVEGLLKSPLTEQYLGDNTGTVRNILTGGERSIKSEISEIISDKSGLSKSSAYTLAYGGTEKAVQKLQSDSLDIAFDGLVDSFPILGQIIDFFSKNQGILTLLGTLGGTLGLSALAGGGLTGGLLGGAGTMLGIRAVLGKEGYENFQSTIGEGASQAIGIFRDMFEKSGLADNEMIGPAIKGILNFAEENPVPTALGATGNIGAAFGSFLAEQGINIADNPDAMNALLGRFENTDYQSTSGSTRSREALGISVRNANQGPSNEPQEFSPDMIPKTDSGPSSAEMRGTSGAMFESRAWANVDTDSGYGWPHGVVNV